MFIVDALEYIGKMRELNRLKVRVVELNAMVDYFRERCYSMEKEIQRKKASDAATRRDGGLGDLFGGLFK